MWSVATAKSIKKAFTVLLSPTTDTCYTTTDWQKNRVIRHAARPDLFGTVSYLLLQHARQLSNSHMRYAECRLLLDPHPH
jgi:hypothetical protein